MTDRLQIVDTHCHLEASEFEEDLTDVVRKADESGVHIITSAIHPETWERALWIANEFECVSLSIGLDPLLHQYGDAALTWIEEHSSSVIAVGETGLDNYRERNHKQRDQQKSAFVALVRKAIDLNLPIQVHSRSAGRVCLEVLTSEEAPLVHMHAFDGRANLAKKASRDCGYYFSIPTSVVRSPQKRKLVKAVHIERLLLETDSPVLGPEKGARNVPSNLPVALREVASILRRNVEELREIILENTIKLYTKIKTN